MAGGKKKKGAATGGGPVAKDDTYFVLVNPLITAVILVGLFYLYPAVVYAPQYLPPKNLTGPFGVFLEYLGEEHAWWMRPAFPFIIAVHVIESFVAMVIAGYLALTPAICLKWGASVFVNGMFALRFLIKRLYDDETKKRDELDTHSGRKKKK